MLYMIVNRTRSDLTAEQFAELGRLAQAFYDEAPEGITLQGDWGAVDGSGTFSLLETDDPDLLERVQEPFRDYVDMEVLPVVPLSGWLNR